MKRYLNGILFAGLSSIVAVMICLGFSMIFLGYKIISIIIFFIVFFGWIFGIKLKRQRQKVKILPNLYVKVNLEQMLKMKIY